MYIKPEFMTKENQFFYDMGLDFMLSNGGKRK